jgi:hypothetical protein
MNTRPPKHALTVPVVLKLLISVKVQSLGKGNKKLWFMVCCAVKAKIVANNYQRIAFASGIEMMLQL